MQKLQLKHLAPYLSYGLTWLDNEQKQHGMVGIVLDTIHIMSETLDYGQFDLSNEIDLKPALRPLSDLSNNIDHDEGVFCPIVELARINDPSLPKVISAETEKWSKVNSSFETAQYNANYKVDYDSGLCDFQFSYWEKSQRFLLRDMTNSLPKGVGHQLEMFNKLFEWKFDVFGLIPQKLAIDMNSLSENVY